MNAIKNGRCMCYNLECTNMEDEYKILCKEDLKIEDIKYIQEYIETHIRNKYKKLHIEPPVIEQHGMIVRRTIFIFY